MDKQDSPVQESEYSKDILFQRLVKNFIFAVVFILVALVSIHTLLWPRIEDYRTRDTEAKQKRTIASYKQEDFVTTLRTYRMLKEKNTSALKYSSYQVVSSTLNKILTKHFSQIKLQEKTRKINALEHSIHESLNIVAHTRSLKDFYNFLDELVAISTYAEIELPVTITKQKNYFIVDFNIHVEYKVTRS